MTEWHHDWNDAHCGAFVWTSLCYVNWDDTTFAKWHHFLTPLLPGGITFWHLFCQMALPSNTTFARRQHFLTTLLPDSITFWHHGCQTASLSSVTYVYLYVVLHHYLGTTPAPLLLPPPPPPKYTLRFCKLSAITFDLHCCFGLDIPELRHVLEANGGGAGWCGQHDGGTGQGTEGLQVRPGLAAAVAQQGQWQGEEEQVQGSLSALRCSEQNVNWKSSDVL